MRDTKFRGKRLDTGEWVYGWYVGNSKSNIAYIYNENAVQYTGELAQYAVIPETVGQYTGLKDKNGVEIYEGDVLGEKDDSFATVVWVEEQTRFGLQFLNGSIDKSRMSLIDWFDNWQYRSWEVIGDIHEKTLNYWRRYDG